MRARCPFCLKRAPRVIVQFEHKPQVEVCGNCEKVLMIDEYDAWYASVWGHRQSRAEYVREVEDQLIMTSFVKLIIPRRNSI